MSISRSGWISTPKLLKQSGITSRWLKLALCAAFPLSVLACAQGEPPQVQLSKLKSPPPIKKELSQLPKKKQCVDPKATEFTVEELENQRDCFAGQLVETRGRFFRYNKAVETRDADMAKEAGDVQTKQPASPK